MTTSPAHIKAQKRIADILCKHYKHIGTEIYTPTPNEKYIYDGEEFVIKPYKIDVYAYIPRTNCDCKHRQIGIEVDGKKGHKTSKRQYTEIFCELALLLAAYTDEFISIDLILKIW
jgi:hypothetical protein